MKTKTFSTQAKRDQFAATVEAKGGKVMTVAGAEGPNADGEFRLFFFPAR
jgi:hypothetical protein